MTQPEHQSDTYQKTEHHPGRKSSYAGPSGGKQGSNHPTFSKPKKRRASKVNWVEELKKLNCAHNTYSTVYPCMHVFRPNYHGTFMIVALSGSHDMYNHVNVSFKYSIHALLLLLINETL